MVIPNKLEVLQDLVGGYIETVTVTDDHCVICNEEGRIRGLEENIWLAGATFYGPILLVGVDDDEFTDVSEAAVRLLCKAAPI